LPAIVAVGLFVSSDPTPALSAAVLTPVVQPVSPGAPQQSDPTIVRSRYAVVSTAALPAFAGADRLPDPPAAPIVLNLFDDLAVVAVFDRFDPNSHGVTWVGHVQGREGSTVTLVYGDDGLVQGNILTLDGTYTIRPAPEDVRASRPQTAGVLHVISQIDLSRRRPTAPPVSVTMPAADRAASAASTQALADTGDFIDLLVVYTPGAASFVGGAGALRTRIELMVSETNTSYANSGVTQRIRLSHVAQVPYSGANFDLSHFVDLENLRTGAPGLEGVAALRDLYSADLVSLVARSDSVSATCGNAYHMDNVSPAFEAMAFSVTDIWCTSSTHVFAEILAQNMGLRYDWFNDNGTTPYTYAHGHLNYVGGAASRFRTLMASHELCTSQNVACQPLLRWSNPTQTFNGVAMGVPAGTRANCATGASDANTCDADSRQVLNNTAPIVANFRQSPSSPPAAFDKTAPADQIVLTGGATTLSWQFAPFAKSYEYCYDLTNNDTCDGAWASTSGLSAQATAIIAGATYYWQVRAVNDYGTTQANSGVWWRFSRQSQAPGSFSKTAPANGAGGQLTALTLSWSASDGAAGYEYCMDSTDNSTCDGNWTSTSTTSVAAAGLTISTGYYWHVRAFNGSGTVYSDNNFWSRFATIDPAPHYPVTTLAGLAGAPGPTDGTGSAARFSFHYGVAVDAVGTIYVADTGNNAIRKITPAGVVTTLATGFNSPKGVAVDSSGTVYVADTSNCTIRKVTPGGAVTTLAGQQSSCSALDGTGAAARFQFPDGVAVDLSGTVYVADTISHLIRKITPAGVVTTWAGVIGGGSGTTDGIGSAARFNLPAGIAVDSAGTVYVSDRGNHRIRKITPAAEVTTLAGQFQSYQDGAGSLAWFRSPQGIVMGADGMIYVADSGNHVIRRVSPTGAVKTLAGLAPVTGTADGVGSAARFNQPQGVAVDSNGVLYIADRGNHTIRRRGPVTGGANLVSNADFGAGTANWSLFGLPDNSYVSSSVVNNVFEFWRVPPPPGSPSQATVFQATGQALPANTALTAQFSLGNSSSVRKRISVLVLDQTDFGDLAVCTFWLPANTPLSTYGLLAYTSRAWANAAIYFYAATGGSDGGAYRLDNVSLQAQPGGPLKATTCLDPWAPVASTASAGSSLLTNGDFATGALAPWGEFGTVTRQISGGVLEFIRPDDTPPAGVVFQVTGQSMTANQILTSTFQLGNSSGALKRVTVLIHDIDFSDLTACTFWLPAGQALSNYVMRTYVTKPWTNAMISFYPATTSGLTWIRLDNVTLQRAPATAITGTQCVEPGGG